MQRELVIMLVMLFAMIIYLQLFRTPLDKNSYSNFKLYQRLQSINFPRKKENIANRKELLHLNSLEKIHNVLFAKIYHLQEIGNCENKKVLLCRNVNVLAGFGSMVSRYGVCMQVGYGLGRMVLIDQPEYAHFGGIFRWVKPESHRCSYLKKKYFNGNYSDKCNMHDRKCYLSNGYEIDNSHKVLELTTEVRFPAPRRIPGTIPLVFEKALHRLGVKIPWIWFTSQFLGYLLLRPNQNFTQTFEDMKTKIGYNTSMVSFHVRHGDKLTSGEAEYIKEERFIQEANIFFSLHNFTRKKQVYLATDDMKVREILLKNGTDFMITGLPSDYLQKALVDYFVKDFPAVVHESTLLDLYFMTFSSFLVCDYSSNLARLVYEFKQALPPYKQDNIAKSVGWQHIAYIWPGFEDFSGNKFFVTKKANDKTLKNIKYDLGELSKQSYKLLKYDKGELFKIIRTVYPLALVRSKNRTPELHGLVFFVDVEEWPGKPKYFVVDY